MIYTQALAVGFLRALGKRPFHGDRDQCPRCVIAHAAYLRLCDQAEGKGGGG